jgi:O-antigen/teichoic acid export membrane protein
MVLSGVLNANNRNSALIRSGAVGAVLTVILGVLFISRFGLIGAALGRLSAQTAVAGLNIVAANRTISGVVRFKWFSRYLFVSSAAAGAAWLGAQAGGVTGLLLGSFAGAAAFVVLTIVSLRFDTDERGALLQFVATKPVLVRRAAATLLGEAA